MATSKNSRDVSINIAAHADTDDVTKLKTELDKAATATKELGKAADSANAEAVTAKRARDAQVEALERLRLAYKGGTIDAAAFKTQELAIQSALVDARAAVRSKAEALTAANLAVRNAATAERALAEQLRTTTSNVQHQATAARTLGGDLQGVGQQLRTIQQLAGAAIGGQLLGGTASEVAKTADAYANLAARIKLSTGDGAAFTSTFADVFAIAQRTGVEVSTVGDLFGKLAQAGKQLGVTNQQVLGLVESITQATQLSGASADSANAALVQLSQGLASGVLRGEELNSILEQAPRLARALADGLGVTTGELRKLGEAGALTSQQVISALQGQAATLRSEFETLPPTIGRAITGLSNAWTQYVGQTDKATGASATIAAAIKTLSNNLDTVANTLYGIGKAAAAFQALRMAQTLLGIGAAATTAAAGVTALATAQNTAAAGAGRLGGMLASIKGFALVGVLTNIKSIGVAIGEQLGEWSQWGAMLRDSEGRMRAQEAAVRATAEAMAQLAQQQQIARDKALGLGKEAQALVGDFNKAREAGDTVADALAKVAKNLQLGDVSGITAAGAALDALAVRGQITADQLRDTLTAALKSADLGKFEVEARAAFDTGEIGARRFAAAVDALTDESLRRAGLSTQELATGFGAAAASAMNDVTALTAAFDRLGAKGPETGAALSKAIGKATEAAVTERALQAVIVRIQELGKAGRLSGEQVAAGLEVARAKIDSLTPGITSLDEALRNFGLRSATELEQTAKLYADSWEAIKNSTVVALDAKIEAFEKYAAAAQAANKGVEVSEVSLQREILRTRQIAEQRTPSTSPNTAPLRPGSNDYRQPDSGQSDQDKQNRIDGYKPNVHRIDHNADRTKELTTSAAASEADRENRLSGQNAVDANLQFQLRDKLLANTLTADDLPDIHTVIQSLKQQAAVNSSASKLSAGFQSNIGAADALQWQQVRTRLENEEKRITRTVNISIGGRSPQGVNVASEQDADALTGILRQLETASRSAAVR